MKNYKFLYDSQTGVYLGLTRNLEIENSTEVEPFFQAGFVTVFRDGLWKLVNKEFYFDEMSKRDSFVEFDLKCIDRIDEHERYLINRLAMLEGLILRNHEAILDRMNADYFAINDRVREVAWSVVDLNCEMSSLVHDTETRIIESLIVSRIRKFFDLVLGFFGVRR